MTTSREPVLSRDEVRQLDRRAMEQFGIPGIVLMENAGRNAAEIINQMAQPGGRIVIVCGRGNNGGDGFVIARHLALAGRAVQILIACEPARLTGDAAVNWNIVERMNLSRSPFFDTQSIALGKSKLARADVIVDALLGTGFSGDVRPPISDAIDSINQARAVSGGRTRVVAIDVPSGLDCDSGLGGKHTIRADMTITMACMKKGFEHPESRAYTGEVRVVGIGAPPSLP